MDTAIKVFGAGNAFWALLLVLFVGFVRWRLPQLRQEELTKTVSTYEELLSGRDRVTVEHREQIKLLEDKAYRLAADLAAKESEMRDLLRRCYQCDRDLERREQRLRQLEALLKSHGHPVPEA